MNHTLPINIRIKLPDIEWFCVSEIDNESEDSTYGVNFPGNFTYLVNSAMNDGYCISDACYRIHGSRGIICFRILLILIYGHYTFANINCYYNFLLSTSKYILFPRVLLIIRCSEFEIKYRLACYTFQICRK